MIRRWLLLRYLAKNREKLLSYGNTSEVPSYIYCFCHQLTNSIFKKKALDLIWEYRVNNFGKSGIYYWFNNAEERLEALDKVIADIKNKRL
jgi:hypothetical protein